MDELIREFLSETFDNLDLADASLVELERRPRDQQLLDSVFRIMHTIKGTCGFVGLRQLGEVAHAAESLLDQIREGEQAMDQEVGSAILKSFDYVRECLDALERGAEEPAFDPELLVRLEALCEREPDGSQAAAAPAAAAEVEDAAPSRQDGVRAVRVDVQVVDKLMALVGELVLARNHVGRLAQERRDLGFLKATQRLAQVTAELQEGVMKTRLQPVSVAWSKVTRTVRDVALQCGKEVRVELEGGDTELDKTVIEAIKDPLLHMVRNAVDHGIETPAKRQEVGKDPEGCLRLRAFHEGGQVNLVIEDDGGGMDYPAIARRAVERGLVAPDRVAQLSRQDLAQLVFRPGFSTAQSISSVSGRGVGMDVVKTNIEAIGGTLEVQSQTGLGTRILLKIPLTLAIVPALIVFAGSERFAIPQVHLRELVSLEAEGSQGIELVHGAPVYRLRGRLLPLVFLDAALGVRPADLSPEGRQRACRDCSLVVLDAAGVEFGLLIGRIGDPEEIVVRPLTPQIQGIPLYAGGAVLGDGVVSLILDVVGLAQMAKVQIAEQVDADHAGAEHPEADEAEADVQVLIQVDALRRAAIPLAEVGRLEYFALEDLETDGPRRVVQYRGRVLELTGLAALLDGSSEPPQLIDPLPVLVVARDGRRHGLVVREIIDICKDAFALDRSRSDAGVRGTAILRGRVTQVLDMERLCDRVFLQEVGHG